MKRGGVAQLEPFLEVLRQGFQLSRQSFIVGARWNQGGQEQIEGLLGVCQVQSCFPGLVHVDQEDPLHAYSLRPAFAQSTQGGP
jgi:hypothetical protein